MSGQSQFCEHHAATTARVCCSGGSDICRLLNVLLAAVGS